MCDEDSNVVSTSCFVHNQRWRPTFLYLLNQCHNRLIIPRQWGNQFTVLLCTCDNTVADYHRYFQTVEQLNVASAETMQTLRSWSQECAIILQPLICQLEKLPASDIGNSLIKFVYYFENCSRGNMQILAPPECTEQNQNAAVGNVNQSSVAIDDTFLEDENLSLASLVSENQPSMDTEPMNVSTPTEPSLPVTQRSLRVPLSERKPGCFFHGPAYKFVFQYILNTMHKHNVLNTNLNLPFSRAVCICERNFDVPEDNSVDDTVRDIRYMNTVLDKWGDKPCIQPIKKLLTNCANSHTVPDGLVVMVFYFKKALENDLSRFEEIFESMKRENNH